MPNFDPIQSQLVSPYLRGPQRFSGKNHAGVYLNKLTTTERDHITAEKGAIIYNTTTDTVQAYNGSSWINLGAYN